MTPEPEAEIGAVVARPTPQEVEIAGVAERLTKGAARACLMMTAEPQLPSRDGLQASGAWALHVFGQKMRRPFVVYGFDRRFLRGFTAALTVMAICWLTGLG